MSSPITKFQALSLKPASFRGPAPRFATVAGLLVGLLVGASSAAAQPNPGAIERLRKRQGIAVTAATPLVDRLLVREESKSWDVRIDLRLPEPRMFGGDVKLEDFITEDRNRFKDVSRPSGGVGDKPRFEFTKARLVFPIPERSAGSIALSGTYSATLLMDDKELIKTDSTTQAWEENLRAGTRLAVFDIGPAKGSRLNLKISAPVVSSRVLFDEAEAAKIDWPTSWPDPVGATLKAQYLVDWRRDPKEAAEAEKAIDELIKKWLNGVDPKTIKPSVLAKRLAAEVMNYVKPTSSGSSTLVYRGDGLYVLGFKVTTAAEVVKDQRLPEEMMASFLTSVYRRAGIPSRVVIGLDIEDKRDRNSGTPGSSGSSRTKWVTWAEFAVYDQAKGEVAWVPVDLARQRRSSSRPGPQDKPWRYFGNHDELDYMVPVAFQFTPPTSVFVRGAPGLWGWSVEPMLPASAGAFKVEALRLNSSDQKRNNSK